METSELSASGTDEGATLFIKRAAAETMDQSAAPVALPREGGALPPKNLLGVIAYCYAKGVYRSEDIERELLKDPGLRAAVGDEVPNPTAIRRFHRLNRAAIEATLQKFYKRERRSRSKVAAGSSAAAAAPGSTPVADGEGTVIIVKREASDRLEQAVIVDNMSRED